MVHGDPFMFDNVKSITLKVPLNRILLPIGRYKRVRFSKNKISILSRKYIFQEFPKCLRIFWSDLVGVIGFLEAGDMD